MGCRNCGNDDFFVAKTNKNRYGLYCRICHLRDHSIKKSLIGKECPIFIEREFVDFDKRLFCETDSIRLLSIKLLDINNVPANTLTVRSVETMICNLLVHRNIKRQLPSKSKMWTVLKFLQKNACIGIRTENVKFGKFTFHATDKMYNRLSSHIKNIKRRCLTDKEIAKEKDKEMEDVYRNFIENEYESWFGEMPPYPYRNDLNYMQKRLSECSSRWE